MRRWYDNVKITFKNRFYNVVGLNWVKIKSNEGITRDDEHSNFNSGAFVITSLLVRRSFSQSVSLCVNQAVSQFHFLVSP
jgi:hypothetical protein